MLSKKLLHRASAVAAVALAVFPAFAQANVFISQRTLVSDNSQPKQDVAFYLTRDRMMIQTFDDLGYDPTNRWYPEQGGRKLPIEGGSRQYIFSGESHVYFILDWAKREIARFPMEKGIAKKVAFDKLVTEKKTFERVYEKLSATGTFGKVKNGNGVWWCQLYEGAMEGVPTSVWVTRGVVETGQKGWSNHEVFPPKEGASPLDRYPRGKSEFRKGAMLIGYPIKVIRKESNRQSVTDTHEVIDGAVFHNDSVLLPQGFKVTTMESMSDFLKKRPTLPGTFPGRFPWPQ